MKFHFDKSTLSDYLTEKQKEKGTFDSPCISVCDYDPTSTVCQTCGLMKAEKKLWKASELKEKEKIAQTVIERNAQK